MFTEGLKHLECKKPKKKKKKKLKKKKKKKKKKKAVGCYCVLEQGTLTPYSTGEYPGRGGSVPTELKSVRNLCHCVTLL